jgi:hypothetical protein
MSKLSSGTSKNGDTNSDKAEAKTVTRQPARTALSMTGM